ncbi:MAG: DUF262 domain-containing protein [Phycisphaeraceae bacterium]|nr:MAG: DUF262 domain-containing protein [Phycisphaeraceae bacterium]
MQPRLKHETVKVKKLIEDFRRGAIVIPEFQRDYVWKKNKAPQLIDSLYQGFPVSSLLVWQSSTEEVRSRKRDSRPIMTDWLIDGQQRVITLVRTMAGDEGIDVVFNAETEDFQLANAATEKDRAWVRVSELWDDDLYRNHRRNLDLDGSRAAEKREEKFERVREILNYEIPVVRMIEHSFGKAVDAFRRINTLGVRLKQEDIESARVAAQHSGFIADQVAPFLSKLHQQGFNRINIMHLFRACAFIAKPDGRNRTPLHELSRSEVVSAWSRTEKATNQAIGLVRSELGLVNMSILWSGALVVPLVVLCHQMSPQRRKSKELIGWLALAAICHRYSGASETAIDQDLRACRESDPVRALIRNLKSDWDTLAAMPNDFSGTLMDRSGLLALYIACMNRGIQSFYDGSKVIMQGDVDRHHILPRAQFPEKTRRRADNLANIAFIAGDVNRSIGSTGPEVYLEKIDPAILRSQCIPEDPALWRIDRAEEFWEARKSLLAESFNDYIGRALPDRRIE